MKVPSRIFAIIVLLALITSQAFCSVDFDWSGQSDYVGACVRDALANRFDFGPLDPSLDFTDCSTEVCLCKPETLQKNIPVYYSKASSICVERGDNDGRAGGQQATSVINAYCNEKGYTSRLGPATTFATSTASPAKPSNVDASTTDTPGPVSTSTPGLQNPTSAPRDDGNALSPGAITGMTLGIAAVSLIVAVWMLCLNWTCCNNWRRRRAARRNDIGILLEDLQPANPQQPVPQPLNAQAPNPPQPAAQQPNDQPINP